VRRIESLLQNRTRTVDVRGANRSRATIVRMESIVQHGSRLAAALKWGDFQPSCELPLAWADFVLRFL